MRDKIRKAVYLREKTYVHPLLYLWFVFMGVSCNGGYNKYVHVIQR